MIPHPAALDAALGSTAYRPFTRVTFANPDGTGRFGFVVADAVDGYLTSSSDSWPRTTLDMVVPTTVVPDDTSLPADPFGGTVTVEAGAVVGNVTYAFRVCELDVYETAVQRPAGTINVRAVSREARVNEARTPYAGGGTPGVLASGLVRALVTEAIYGDAFAAPYPVLVDLTTDELVETPNPQGDQWPQVVEVMDQCGAEAYFRWDNKLVLRDVPVKGTPVVTVKAGSGGTLLDYRSLRRWAASVVQVVYTKPDGTERVGTWEQTTGPARAAGPYGRHVRLDVRDVETLPSTTRADKAAAALAKRAAGPLRRVELSCIPMPWIEPGDTVQVELPGEGTETQLVTGVRWPLSQLDPMTIVTADADYS